MSYISGVLQTDPLTQTQMVTLYLLVFVFFILAAVSYGVFSAVVNGRIVAAKTLEVSQESHQRQLEESSRRFESMMTQLQSFMDRSLEEQARQSEHILEDFKEGLQLIANNSQKNAEMQTTNIKRLLIEDRQDNMRAIEHVIRQTTKEVIPEMIKEVVRNGKNF